MSYVTALMHFPDDIDENTQVFLLFPVTAKIVIIKTDRSYFLAKSAHPNQTALSVIQQDFPAGTQRRNDIVFNQCDVMSHRHQYDFISKSCACWVMINIPKQEK